MIRWLASTGCLFLVVGCATPKPAPIKLEPFHQGPWEKEIGYAQAIRAGHVIYVSGTVGADEKGFPKDLESQLKLAFRAIEETLKAQGATLQDVAVERIYTTDMEALKKCQELRKQIYGGHLPAATWVEVRKLYTPESLIEIEVEAVK